MAQYYEKWIVLTEAHFGVENLTERVKDVVADQWAKGQLKTGILTVMTTGSACGILVIEDEQRLVQVDLRKILNRYAPYRDSSGRLIDYAHHEVYQDDNGSSHLKAALMGPSVTLPFREGKVILGPFQSILLVECDTQDRKREVHLQMIGE